LEASIITHPKRLTGRLKKFTTGLAKFVTNIPRFFKKAGPNIKEDVAEKTLETKQGASSLRKKTVALFRKPLSDVSHLSIIVVIALALFSGISGITLSKEQVSVNPFVQQTQTTNQYVSATQKRILEADLVTTMASIHSDKLGSDAVKITEDIYKNASSVNTQTASLASVPIVQTVSAASSANVPTSYVVQDGDTLSTLAVKFNVSTDTIRYANGITDVDSIKPGQTLSIPTMTGILYAVKDGDSTASIASKYQVDEGLIISTNDLYGIDLTAGMKLMLPDAAIPEIPKPVVAPDTSTSNSSSGSYSAPVSRVASSSGPNRFPWGWCTWYAASRRYVPWSGNAYNWYENAQGYGYSTGRAPVPGAIMVTGESGWGHVAYVESVNGNSFTVSEMNYQGFGVISTRTINAGAGFIRGFIY